jgi:hypothetical protein
MAGTNESGQDEEHRYLRNHNLGQRSTRSFPSLVIASEQSPYRHWRPLPKQGQPSDNIISHEQASCTASARASDPKIAFYETITRNGRLNIRPAKTG